MSNNNERKCIAFTITDDDVVQITKSDVRGAIDAINAKKALTDDQQQIVLMALWRIHEEMLTEQLPS